MRNQEERDLLTGLYGPKTGRWLVGEYLSKRDPYTSCGMLAVNIDDFRAINEEYGHFAGDQVLVVLAGFLACHFGENGIVIRSGGDEFMIFVKTIPHKELVKQTVTFMDALRTLQFPMEGCVVTCSVGVCFLEENASGYSYDNLAENARGALQQAKKRGKNRLVFCNHLKQHEPVGDGKNARPDIDARYFRGDVISIAFEIFDKTCSFQAAMDMLLEILGLRFQLDRITVIWTDIKEKTTKRMYQWLGPGIPEALSVPGSFSKEDFLTLFHGYDENGSIVLQAGQMGQYSEDAANLLMQGDAKTVLYAAMYCEGKYTGAISYVTCREHREWSGEQRSRLGELTKMISAHLAKSLAMNASISNILAQPEYDAVTGLLSFTKFKEETERLIVGGYACGYGMAYLDFEDFKHFNRKYGYSSGDELLKDYCGYMMNFLEGKPEVYFSRVVADQFILFLPCDDAGETAAWLEQLNDSFISDERKGYAGMRLRIRAGLYPIDRDCLSASAAIDAANFARREVRSTGRTVRIYDEELDRKQKIEQEIVNNLDDMMEKGRFQVYLQPKFSIADYQVTGAEALIRWTLEDGTVAAPAVFVPVLEKSGRIVDLDFYVFEKVVQFLKKNDRKHRRQVPISVNASALHAMEKDTVSRYLAILEQYEVEPALTEIELTETAAVANFDSAKRLFKRLHGAQIRTSMDDFGAGYSVLNMVVDIPVDTVKIDQLLIRNCEQGERGIYFLKSLISMVKGLGYHVVCEGVEDAEQVRILKEIGCDEAQGYWFSPPLPIDEYEKLVYGEEGEKIP